jgi:hypothetical protein
MPTESTLFADAAAATNSSDPGHVLFTASQCEQQD